MDCTIMHKDIPVVDIVIKGSRGYVEKITALHSPEHLPVGTAGIGKNEKNTPDLNRLDEWLSGRSIPASRDNLEAALLILGIQSPLELITKCYGLSLSDQYWICPRDSDLTWKDVNFFENDFSKDVGEALFGIKPMSVVDMISPDNTSDGWLQKKWIISGGKRFLMKGSGSGFEQEPFNELVAAAIMRRLNISHVPYTLTFDAGKPYSLCENFVTPETELIPALRVIQTQKQSNNDSALTHLLRCCENLGIPEVPGAIDKMLTLDCLIENEDRHYNNFGFLRNANTLEWQGAAPIFDSGTSLWHNNPRVGLRGASKPFKTSHSEQIKLVNNFEWFDLGALNGIVSECEEIFAKSNVKLPERWTAIANAVWNRAEEIEANKKKKKGGFFHD